MFGAIAGGIASALAGGAMSKLFGGGQKAASGGIQGDVLATDNNTVGMGDAGIKSAIQGSTNLLKFMRASIKMIGVSNLQSFIASMTQKLTLSDISDESKNYLDKAGITTACLRIK